MTARPTYVDDRLDFLVNVEGIDQLTASQMLYAPELFTIPGAPASSSTSTPIFDQVWIESTLRQIVRDRLGRVLEWLGATA